MHDCSLPNFFCALCVCLYAYGYNRKQLEDLSVKTGKPIEVEKVLKYVIQYMFDKNMKMDNTEG
jgi:hypothetical protein